MQPHGRAGAVAPAPVAAWDGDSDFDTPVIPNANSAPVTGAAMQQENCSALGAAQATPVAAWDGDSTFDTAIVPNADKSQKSVTETLSIPVSSKPNKKVTGLFEFSNCDAIKEKVRAQKFDPHPYDVSDFYHESGFARWLATHPTFENLTLGVIVVNALWLSIDTDLNDSDTMLDAAVPFVIADVMFFSYFLFELAVRFLAFRRKCDCFKDAWFRFDTALVLLYAFDPFTIAILAAAQGGGGLNLPTALLRLFRLARLSRLVRMLRSLPELMVMIKGMITATSTVGYTLILLMIATYIFAIAFVNVVDKELSISEDFFSTVPETMHNLIMYGTFLDALSDVLVPIKEQSTLAFLLMWMYIAIASLTILNMLIGVLCEVISAVAEEEKESMMVDKINEKFRSICELIDRNGDGYLSWAEFSKILEYEEAVKTLESVDVDPDGMIDAAEDLFWDDGEQVKVSFEEFMTLVMDMRASNKVSVAHLMSHSKRMAKKFYETKSTLSDLRTDMKTMDSKIETLSAQIKGIDSKLDRIQLAC